VTVELALDVVSRRVLDVEVGYKQAERRRVLGCFVCHSLLGHPIQCSLS
jgi:hypothetical protein